MYHVYRVLLRSEVWRCPKFRRRNEGVLSAFPQSEGRDAYYVGHTGQRVNRRVESHLLGNPGMGGSNMVKLYARLSDGEADYSVLGTYETRHEAFLREQLEASRLRASGYGVWVNVKLTR